MLLLKKCFRVCTSLKNSTVDGQNGNSSDFDHPDSTATPTSLLSALRKDEPQAWARLVELWTPLIYAHCRRGGFSAEDADDITQAVLISVFRGLHQFERDGAGKRLRFWMMAIVRNEVSTFCRRRQRIPVAVGGSDYLNLMNTFCAVDDSTDGAWCPPAVVVSRALQLIKADFQEKTWKAFELVEFQRLSNQEAGQQLGLAAGAVRQATFRIRQRLKAEIEDMLE